MAHNRLCVFKFVCCYSSSVWMDGEGWFVILVVSVVGELCSIKLDAGLAFIVRGTALVYLLFMAN